MRGNKRNQAAERARRDHGGIRRSDGESQREIAFPESEKRKRGAPFQAVAAPLHRRSGIDGIFERPCDQRGIDPQRRHSRSVSCRCIKPHRPLRGAYLPRLFPEQRNETQGGRKQKRDLRGKPAEEEQKLVRCHNNIEAAKPNDRRKQRDRKSYAAQHRFRRDGVSVQEKQRRRAAVNKKRIGDGDKQKQEDVENGVAACPPAAIEHGAESNAAKERGKLKRRARRKSETSSTDQKSRNAAAAGWTVSKYLIGALLSFFSPLPRSSRSVKQSSRAAPLARPSVK